MGKKCQCPVEHTVPLELSCEGDRGDLDQVENDNREEDDDQCNNNGDMDEDLQMLEEPDEEGQPKVRHPPARC